MTDQYINGIKVRHVPMGVFGSDLSPQRTTKLGIPTFGRPIEGYEAVKDASKRLGVPVRTIYKLCSDGKIEHVVVGRDKSKRVFIKKLAVPKT